MASGALTTHKPPSVGALRGTGRDRATKETFVQSMIRHMSDSLASDAEFGHNSANKIRRRVDEIADSITPSKGGESTSAGRAVLEARFALGGDNAQYLTQAVAMLWAGDGGERLRLVPPAMMPAIMRHASAEGIVNAMRKVMEEKKTKNTAAISCALELVGWMMQVPIIREAVTHHISCSNVDEVKQEFNEILELYKTSNDGGMLNVTQIMSGDSASKHAVARAMLDAVYSLVDVNGHPMQVYVHLMAAMTSVVDKAAIDTGTVHELAKITGLLSQYKAAPTRQDVETPTGQALPCKQFYSNGKRRAATDADIPLQSQFQSAIRLAHTAMAATNNSVLLEDTNVRVTTTDNDAAATDTDAAATDSKKPWALQRIVSPFWNQGRLNEAEYEGLLTASVPNAPNLELDQMSTAMAQTLEDDPSIRNFGDLRKDRLGNVATYGSEFVSFCMIRGLCGFKGPHQSCAEGSLSESELPYDFPLTEMRTHYRRHRYVQLEDTELSHEPLEQLRNTNSKIYSDPSPERLGVDTDFAASVIYKLGGDVQVGRFDNAMPICWAPIPAKDYTARPNNEIDHTETSVATCEASVHEFMLCSLQQKKAQSENGAESDKEGKTATLRAAAACVKIHQLSSMATVRADGQYSRFVRTPSDAGNIHQYVTRPARQCRRSGVCSVDGLSVPVDAGIARFRSNIGTTTLEPAFVNVDGDYEHSVTVPLRGQYPMSVKANVVDSWLRGGMQNGWKRERDGEVIAHPKVHHDFSLTFQGYADTTPFNVKDGADCGATNVTLKAQSSNDGVDADDLDVDSVRNVITRAINALVEIEQLHREESYIDRLSRDDTEERRGVFGIHTAATFEQASRSRRESVWSDALREVAVSGDRLYRFVTTLTGAIGESADSAIAWEDEDLKQMAKDAANRQKAIAERVQRFQTKLVESVVSTTLKASKLQLDMRGHSADDQELVVLSSDVKDNIRQITDGDAGHGFFESHVELNEALGRTAKPMTINQIVGKLQNVTEAFHHEIAASMAFSSGASYSRVVEPRNSYMLHLKPDTLAAIQKAYDYIVSEIRHCDGIHRSIHLWEFVEGKDWVLATRFAELVGLMLQNTRMRSGSFAAYVGTSQLISNGHNIRLQIQRLRTQACHYLSKEHDAPHWLTAHGRTRYFGGTVAPLKHQVKRDSKRKRDALHAADGDDDDLNGGWRGGHRESARFRRLLARHVQFYLDSSGSHRTGISHSSAQQRAFFADLGKTHSGFGATNGQVLRAQASLIVDEVKNNPVNLEPVTQVYVEGATLNGTAKRILQQLTSPEYINAHGCIFEKHEVNKDRLALPDSSDCIKQVDGQMNYCAHIDTSELFVGQIPGNGTQSVSDALNQVFGISKDWHQKGAEGPWMGKVEAGDPAYNRQLNIAVRRVRDVLALGTMTVGVAAAAVLAMHYQAVLDAAVPKFGVGDAAKHLCKQAMAAFASQLNPFRTVTWPAERRRVFDFLVGDTFRRINLCLFSSREDWANIKRKWNYRRVILSTIVLQLTQSTNLLQRSAQPLTNNDAQNLIDLSRDLTFHQRMQSVLTQPDPALESRNDIDLHWLQDADTNTLLNSFVHAALSAASPAVDIAEAQNGVETILRGVLQRSGNTEEEAIANTTKAYLSAVGNHDGVPSRCEEPVPTTRSAVAQNLLACVGGKAQMAEPMQILYTLIKQLESARSGLKALEALPETGTSYEHKQNIEIQKLEFDEQMSVLYQQAQQALIFDARLAGTIKNATEKQERTGLLLEAGKRMVDIRYEGQPLFQRYYGKKSENIVTNPGAISTDGANAQYVDAFFTVAANDKPVADAAIKISDNLQSALMSGLDKLRGENRGHNAEFFANKFQATLIMTFPLITFDDQDFTRLQSAFVSDQEHPRTFMVALFTLVQQKMKGALANMSQQGQGTVGVPAS